MYRNKLSVLACLLPVLPLLFAGCGALKPSPAWSAATSLNVPGKGDYQQSDAYAKGVAQELARRGIPNKVVTFRYTVADEHNNPRVITRSSVIYRDETRPDYPWWMVDNMVRLPVWLPNTNVAEQVHFLTRYNPEIIAVKQESLEVAAIPACPASPARSTCPTCPAARSKEEREALFYKYNGTRFDPASTVDRRKMAALCDSRAAVR